MELITKAPKGTADITPEEARKWHVVEDVMKNEAELNGFQEIRTPVFEHTELFLRGVGDTTDVVEKQMYTFEDKGGRSITLKPEGTAGAVRAMLERGLFNAGFPIKLYYDTSCYRYEKPQAGRMRELHQFGVEVFGAPEPVADAQVIAMALSIFKRLGIDVGLEINSIGCPECRKEYHAALRAYFEGYRNELCETCLSRLERNPMRILDCKSPVCSELAKKAPKMLDYLCDDCRLHFERLREYLDGAGMEYNVNPSLVRGLDYYTKTVFEFPSKELGFALGGGGRYDGLVEELGGAPTAGLGFGLGLDRIMLAFEKTRPQLDSEKVCEVFIASTGREMTMKAFRLVNMLHESGVAADCDLCGRSLKAQMKYADRINARYTIVIGDDELAQGSADIKEMKSGDRRKISIGGDFVKDYLMAVTEQEGLKF